MNDSQANLDPINPQLTRLLLRPLHHPGVIGTQLAESVLLRTQRLADRLPIASRLWQRQRLSGERSGGVPLVYAQPIAPVQSPSNAVRSSPGHTLETAASTTGAKAAAQGNPGQRPSVRPSGSAQRVTPLPRQSVTSAPGHRPSATVVQPLAQSKSLPNAAQPATPQSPPPTHSSGLHNPGSAPGSTLAVPSASLTAVRSNSGGPRSQSMVSPSPSPIASPAALPLPLTAPIQRQVAPPPEPVGRPHAPPTDQPVTYPEQRPATAAPTVLPLPRAVPQPSLGADIPSKPTAQKALPNPLAPAPEPSPKKWPSASPVPPSAPSAKISARGSDAVNSLRSVPTPLGPALSAKAMRPHPPTTAQRQLSRPRVAPLAPSVSVAPVSTPPLIFNHNLPSPAPVRASKPAEVIQKAPLSAPATVIQRQGEGGSVSAAETKGATKAAVDLEDLTEQVQRRLMRQLAIASERGALPPWV